MNNRKVSTLSDRLGAIDTAYNSLLGKSGLLDNEVDDEVTTNSDRLAASDTVSNNVENKVYDTGKNLRREKKILKRMRRKVKEQSDALTNATQNCKDNTTKHGGQNRTVK